MINFSGHSNGQTLTCAHPKKGMSDSVNLQNDQLTAKGIKECFDEYAQHSQNIVLQACNTGKKRWGGNLAQGVANEAKKVVIAPDGYVGVIGSFSFIGGFDFSFSNKTKIFIPK